MTNPMIRIHDLATNEIVDREMNADELKQHEADKKVYAAKTQAEDSKVAEKTALLAKLGITPDEAKLLLS